MDVAADGWFEREVMVRFRDLDSMGHAHHSLPLIYLEEARAAFWRELKGSSALDAIDYVMAEVTLRFRARITYPARLRVRLSVTRVGAKSFGTDFEVLDEQGRLLSDGSAVQVTFDYERGMSRPIDPAERDVLEAWRDARRQNSSAMPADTAPISPPRT